MIIKKLFFVACLAGSVTFSLASYANQDYVAAETDVAPTSPQQGAVLAQNDANTQAAPAAAQATPTDGQQQAYAGNGNSNQLAMPNIPAMPAVTATAPAPAPAAAPQNQNVPLAKAPAKPTAANSANSTPGPVQSSVQAFAKPKLSSTYSDAQKQTWFNSCVPAVSDNRVSPFAQEFCTCGWQHIASGELSPELLTSTNPADAQKRGTVLQTISQECIVQIMANHKLG